jgi:hypothetical protein
MTSPTAPGSVPPPMDDTARRIAALERRVDELTRRDLSNAQVGQGGRLRGLYSNGQEAFQFGLDPVDGVNKSLIRYSNGTRAIGVGAGAAAYGSQEQLSIFDLAGNGVLVTDEVAGYGLSHPSLSYLLGQNFAGSGGAVPAATETAVLEGYSILYNPAVLFRALVRTTGTWTARFVLMDGAGVIQTSTTATATQTDNQYVNKMISVPEEAIAQLGWSLRLLVTSSAGLATVNAYPLRSVGVSQAYYLQNPGLQ